MKLDTYTLLILILGVFLQTHYTFAQESRNELKLGTLVSGGFGSVASVPLTLSTTDEIQGIVAAFEWDDAKGVGESIRAENGVSDADTIVTRIESGFAVVGVVMDADGVDNERILPGEDIAIATVGIRCGSLPEATDLVFVDNKYATVADGEKLENLVVVGGLSITAAEGLILTNGNFECVEQSTTFFIGTPDGGNPTADSNGCGNASVMLLNPGPVEGYVVALCHDPAVLTVEDIQVGDAATGVGAEFTSVDILSNGGTIGVVLDFAQPFEGQTITPGDSNEIAVYRYCCNQPPSPGQPALATQLEFCDTTLGDPFKENVTVVGGHSIGQAEGLLLQNGTFECPPGGGEPPSEDCNNGTDDDGDRLIDAADPDCAGQRLRCTTSKAPLGGQTNVDLLLLTFPDQVQGFSVAIDHCCELTGAEALDISGTIIEALGAEFISVQEDGDPGDGDGCETIVGVLVDALPPFDGATIPPLPNFQKVGTLWYDITDDPAACDAICEINFTDGINGRGTVPVKNLISVDNDSRSVLLENCEVQFSGPEFFYRGDCNFSVMGSMSVDISDAAATVSFLFLSGNLQYHPPCLDACDCNDDGRVDLADTICILQFYLQGGQFPPNPGPGLELLTGGGIRETRPGPDPTEDTLECNAGLRCVK